MGKMTAISIACSEKNHFPSLARKKSKGKGNLSDFFIGFFHRSLGKFHRSLGKNLVCHRRNFRKTQKSALILEKILRVG
jgi:hypothetical protein